jgi:hypothetical protein
MSTQEAVMTTKDIANRLMQLFKENKWNEAQDELFDDDCESIEPLHSQMPNAKGREGLRKKGQAFTDSIEEVHGGFVSEPLITGNYIAVSMGYDCTMKGMGRQKMEEIALYQVKEGKIVREEFFY